MQDKSKAGKPSQKGLRPKGSLVNRVALVALIVIVSLLTFLVAGLFKDGSSFFSGNSDSSNLPEIADQSLTRADIADIASATFKETEQPQLLILDGNKLSISNGNTVELLSTGSNTTVVNSTTGSTDTSGLVGKTTGFGGDVSGTYNNLQIDANAIGTAEILDGSIGLADLSQAGCASGEIIKWNGSTWACAADDNAGTTYTGGAGIVVSGANVISSVLGDDITSVEIVDGTVQTVDIATGAITSTLVLDGTIGNADLAADAVQTANILNGTILNADLANSSLTVTAGTGLSGGGLVSLGGTTTLSATLGTTVDSSEIVDGTIVATDLATGAITSTLILDGTIANADLATDAVQTGNILNGTILNADLANSSLTVTAGTGLSGGGLISLGGSTTLSATLGTTVDSAEIVDGTIVATDLATGAITSTLILDGTIANGDLAADAIQTGNILNGTIATVDLADGVVTNIKLANSSLTVTAGTGLSGGGLVSLGGSTSLSATLGTTIDSAEIVDGTIVATDLATGAITSTLILDGEVANADLATDAVQTGNILNGTILNADLANSSLTVTAGSGLSGGGSVSLGGTVTVSRAAGAATGDLEYWNGTSWTTLTIGADNRVLTASGGVPTWAALTGAVCGTTAFCQNGGAFGATAVLGTTDANGLNIITAGNVVQSLSATGAVTFKNNTNSTSGFQIQSANGTSLLNVDTTGANQNNAVTNPSFEIDTTGWTARTGATLTRDTSTKYDGVASALSTNTATANAGVNYPVALVSATNYNFVVYVKTSAYMTTLEIGRSENGSTDTACLTAQTVTTTGWTRYSCAFTTGTTSGSPYLYVKQTDSVARNLSIDAALLQTDVNGDSNYRSAKFQVNGIINSSVILQNAENSTTAFVIQNAAGGQILGVDTTDINNLIQNPSYEINTTGWAAKSTATIFRDTTQQNFGLASLRIVAPATANTGVQQTLAASVPVSTYITMSFSAKLGSGAFGASTLQAGYVNGGGDVPCTISPVSSATVPSTTGWTRFSCNIQVTTTAATAIYIKQTDAVARTYYIDAVQIETSTIAAQPATAYGLGRISLSGDIVTPVNFRNSTDTSNAFAIQRASGATVLSLDNSVATAVLTLTGSLTQSSGAVALTANAASSVTTSAGVLTLTGGGGITATATGANAANFGTGAGTGLVTFGTISSTTGVGVNILGPTYTTSTRGVTIGTSDGNVTLLNLDVSTATAVETAANCSTAINPGGIYYSSGVSGNNTTNAIRGCINGTFQDVISSDQLGVLLVGVVPTSGSNAGDMSNANLGPCKVSWASTTSVSVAPCIAYSQGRKVVVSAATTVSALNGVSLVYHICLSGLSGVPTATVGNASETANVPTYSATAPVLCIADVRTGAGSTITNIYDTRTFTNTTKQFITTTSAASYSAGMIVKLTGANGVGTTTTASDTPVYGVVAVGNSAGTAGAQLIIATAGPGYVKSTGVVTVGQTAQTSTTAGYALSAASAAGYRDAGLIINGVSTTCTTTTDCQYSMLVSLNAH